MSKERNRGHREAKKPKANKKPAQAGLDLPAAAATGEPEAGQTKVATPK